MVLVWVPFKIVSRQFVKWPVAGSWSVVFYDTLASFINKTDCHDINETLLKVVLNRDDLFQLFNWVQLFSSEKKKIFRGTLCIHVWILFLNWKKKIWRLQNRSNMDLLKRDVDDFSYFSLIFSYFIFKQESFLVKHHITITLKLGKTEHWINYKKKRSLRLDLFRFPWRLCMYNPRWRG